MLIKFIFSNFRSFEEETVLDMAATSDLSHDDHFYSHKLLGDTNILKTAAIYGANASGKSNLIKAAAFAKNFILQGTTSPDEPIEVVPFKFNRDKNKEPASFEFIFLQNDVIYQYGFKIIKDAVLEEWMFEKSKTRFVNVFQRQYTGGKISEYKFYPALKKKLQKKDEINRYSFVMENTRPNQLFITKADKNNLLAFDPVINWFKFNLNFIMPNAKYLTLPFDLNSDKKFRNRLKYILQKTGIDIKDFKFEKKDMMDELDLPKEIMAKLKQDVINRSGSILTTLNKDYYFVQDDKGDLKALKIKTLHKTKDGSSAELEIEEESDGTLRFLDLIPAVIFLAQGDGVYFIDEMERSLHPKLPKALLKIFYNLSKEKSQIIFTTHETNLLEQDLLRRDEIWFIEKNSYGGSELKSLSEYRVRKDLDLEKGYLNGRFGAVPFIKENIELT